MQGAETLDHVAFPVRDLPRAEKFYLETVGLTFLTQRKNADGSPRHTYVKAGENIVGLTLPGVSVPASTSGAPRYAIAIANAEIFDAAVTRVRASGVQCGKVERSLGSSRHSFNPFNLSIRTTTTWSFACAGARWRKEMASAM